MDVSGSGSPLSQKTKALIALLADDAPRIVDTVRERLLALGEVALPDLREAERGPDAKVRLRARSLVTDIQRASLEKTLLSFMAEEDPDLELGAFHIERIYYPEFSDDACREKLDDIAGGAREALDFADRFQGGSPVARIRAFVRYMVKDQCFRGNESNYYDPANSFISRVLGRRLGIPISLSVVYLLVARRLDLNLRGIGMPLHFLVRFEEGDYRTFVDPFYGGKLMTVEDCVKFLRSQGHSFHPRYLEPASSRDILRRMMGNLIRIYTSRGRKTEVDRLAKFVEALNGGQGNARGAHQA
jgi:regulator of sirC expression with transglutaminase-like and TPR domain